MSTGFDSISPPCSDAGCDGSVLANPPLIEHIAADPVLADSKLIAEAWDAAGLYQVGSFPAWGRWAELNGRFRDDVRRFVKGEAGLAGAVATRLAGSPDLYRADGRSAHHSINFITSHDGFTLADLVAYDRKHNDNNGEGGRDGTDQNDSWNCGWEGANAPANVERLRRQQTRNLVTILFLSQGVPMMLAGDEHGRTQLGNNNAYCHDSAVSWVNWDPDVQDRAFLRFVTRLIAFRRGHPQLLSGGFLDGAHGIPAAEWHGRQPGQPDWSRDSRLLVMRLRGGSMPATCASPSTCTGKRRMSSSRILHQGAHGDVRSTPAGPVRTTSSKQLIRYRLPTTPTCSHLAASLSWKPKKNANA